jgi:hypothetical protein
MAEGVRLLVMILCCCLCCFLHVAIMHVVTYTLVFAAMTLDVCSKGWIMWQCLFHCCLYCFFMLLHVFEVYVVCLVIYFKLMMRSLRIHCKHLCFFLHMHVWVLNNTLDDFNSFVEGMFEIHREMLHVGGFLACMWHCGVCLKSDPMALRTMDYANQRDC